MKKIFILLLSTGFLNSTNAQGNYYGKDNYNNSGSYSNMNNGNYGHGNRNFQYENQKKIQWERINREYNTMVISIQNNPYMSRRQKRLAFRDAERQKDHQIWQLKKEFNGYSYNNWRDY